MKQIQVKNLIFGKGKPKVCIPLVSKTKDEIIEEIHNISQFPFDVVEWRIDYFEQLDQMIETLSTIHTLLQDKVILVTYRTKEEGGNASIAPASYAKKYKMLIDTNLVNLIDVQVYYDEEAVNDLISYAHHHHVYVIGSYHNFTSTPRFEECMHIGKYMQEKHVDICKLACMPQRKQDVLTILAFTSEASDQLDCPVITMSMSALGAVSRICGEVFGSCMTFASGKYASAPGQIQVNELQHILDILHIQ